MSSPVLARLAGMNRGELAWRSSAAARIALDRTLAAVRRPQWNRRHLLRVLARDAALEGIRRALAGERWDAAHAALAQHFSSAPRRFPIGWQVKRSLPARVRREYPDAAHFAVRRADRIIAGEYDLLGYERLRFGDRALPDWHADPVHDRRAPRTFWATVPYLDPACGDHKIIWELNRHQHWLALGRAYWLTGRHQYRSRFVAEFEDWLANNPPLVGINWSSMLELGFRAISWLWALHFFVEPNQTDAGAPWLVDLLLGLDRQLVQVERNLSYYFSPNTHLLGEALALYVAGRALPELAASARREAIGRRILVDQIARQVTGDGGHCERSAHYHRYTLDFYMLALVVARLTGDGVAAEFERATARLGFAARLLADDRGRLPHLGDDDGGSLLPITGRAVDDVRDSLASAAALVGRPDLQIGAAPEETLWLLDGLELPRSGRGASDRIASAALPETGYYVSRSADGTHAVIDAGPHGYQNGGHAHADALSLTLTVRHVPFIIDPGTGCYTIDTSMRDRMRSSALHNTVIVDGEPQSVPLDPFHWSRTAEGRALRWRTNDAFDYFDGTHDGYRSVSHRRRLLALHGDLLVVADLVDGRGEHEAHAHWHIDPRWTVESAPPLTSCSMRGEQVRIWTPSGEVVVLSGDATSGLGWHSPAYGVVEPATTLRIASRGTAPFWMISVFELTAVNSVAAVELMPVWAQAGALAHATAVRIVRTHTVDVVMFAEPAAPEPERSATRAAVPPTWRIGEFETDACLLFCRTAGDGQVTTMAMVDGSLARRTGRRGLSLALPRSVPDFHLDLSGEPRLAGPAFGARLNVGGLEHALDVDRRATPRT